MSSTTQKTLSQELNDLDIESVTELCEKSGVNRQTLANWQKHKRKLFLMLAAGFNSQHQESSWIDVEERLPETFESENSAYEDWLFSKPVPVIIKGFSNLGIAKYCTNKHKKELNHWVMQSAFNHDCFAVISWFDIPENNGL